MVHKIARPVSIIGTSTLGQRYFDDPEYAGLSIYELWAYACHQAMEDAGVKPKDVDKLVYSHFAYFPTCGNIMAPVGIMEEWIGMRHKPIIHVEQACASGYVSFMEACDSVASGKYDIVMVAGVESPKHFIPRNQPAYRIHPLSEYDQWWHPGRAEKQQVKISELKEERFTLLNRKYSPIIVDYMISLCVKNGFSPNVTHYVNSAEEGLELAAAGKGISFIHSEMKFEGLDKKYNVKFLDIDDKVTNLAFALIYKKRNRKHVLHQLITALELKHCHRNDSK